MQVLHLKLARVFHDGPSFNFYHFVGWGERARSNCHNVSSLMRMFPGAPLITIVIWCVITEYELSSVACWQGYPESPFVWLLTAPMLAMLIVSTL